MTGWGNLIASKGRRGDTRVAHLSDWQQKLLKQLMGGAGTTNPETGQPEYNSYVTDRISGMYDRFLGRSADDAGHNYYTDQVTSGDMSLLDVRQALTGSDEGQRYSTKKRTGEKTAEQRDMADDGRGNNSTGDNPTYRSSSSSSSSGGSSSSSSSGGSSSSSSSGGSSSSSSSGGSSSNTTYVSPTTMQNVAEQASSLINTGSTIANAHTQGQQSGYDQASQEFGEQISGYEEQIGDLQSRIDEVMSQIGQQQEQQQEQQPNQAVPDILELIPGMIEQSLAGYQQPAPSAYMPPPGVVLNRRTGEREQGRGVQPAQYRSPFQASRRRGWGDFVRV